MRSWVLDFTVGLSGILSVMIFTFAFTGVAGAVTELIAASGLLPEGGRNFLWASGFFASVMFALYAGVRTWFYLIQRSAADSASHPAPPVGRRGLALLLVSLVVASGFWGHYALRRADANKARAADARKDARR